MKAHIPPTHHRPDVGRCTQPRRSHGPLLWAIALSAALFALACGSKTPNNTPNNPQNAPGAAQGTQGLWNGVDPPKAARNNENFSLKQSPSPVPKPDRAPLDPLGSAKAPADGPTKADTKPLKVLRTTPTGEIGLYKTISVTFNQPMVALTQASDLPADQSPLSIEPPIPGRFRWVGTSTLVFEAQDRLPFSTAFKATVSGNAASVSGQKLDKPHTFEFHTPTMKVDLWYPPHNSSRETPQTAFVVRFNQKIDPQAVFEHAVLKSKSGKIPLRRLTLDEARQHPILSAIMKDPQKVPADQTLALAPVNPLELDTNYVLTFDEDTPSAEGPKPMGQTHSNRIHTYSPLKFTQARCGYSRGRRVECPTWDNTPALTFNNPLAVQELDKLISVEPKPENLKIFTQHHELLIQADWQPAQSYTVTLAAGLKDIYGQTDAKGQKVVVVHPKPASTMDFGVRGMTVVESKGPTIFPLNITNISKVKIEAAVFDGKDLQKVLQHTQQVHWHKWKPFGIDALKRSSTWDLTPDKDILTLQRLGVSLRDVLGERKHGLVYLVASAPELKKRYGKGRQALVLQVTNIGLMARYDTDTIFAMATELESGKALDSAALQLLDQDGQQVWSGFSGPDGLAVIPGARDMEGKNGPFILEASKDGDRAYAEINGRGAEGYAYSYNARRLKAQPEQSLAMTFVTDRDIYRPGEEVHFKGIVRLKGPQSGVKPAAYLKEVKCELRDARGQLLFDNKTVEVSPFGTFWLKHTIPANAALGNIHLHVTADSPPDSAQDTQSFGHSVSVSQYRAPEFKVEVKALEPNLFFEQPFKGRIDARYFFGAPMRGARVSWSLRRSEARFTPPGQDGFEFGSASFGRYFDWRFVDNPRTQPASMIDSGQGVVDNNGQLLIERVMERTVTNPQTMKEETLQGAWTVTLEATATDSNRQQISGRATATVHPAAFYTGMKLDKAMLKEGQEATISAVAVSPDGERQIGAPLKIEVVEKVSERTLERGADGSMAYKWSTSERPIGDCDRTSAAEPVQCKIKMTRSGYFEVRVTSKDKDGNAVQTARNVYVYGKAFVPWRQDQGFEIGLIADKASYKAGDTARLLIKSPFERARGLLTLERGGILEHRVIEVEGSVSTVEIPIKAEHLPQLSVALALTRGRVQIEGVDPKEAGDIGRPAFAKGLALLKVADAPKRLTVTATPKTPTATPGQPFSVDLHVTDHLGNGRAAEVALYVVDEGVLSLRGFRTPDPLGAFFHTWGQGTVLWDSRNLLLQRDETLKAVALRKRNRRQSLDKKPAAARLMGQQKEENEKALDGLLALGYIEGGSGDISGDSDKFGVAMSGESITLAAGRISGRTGAEERSLRGGFSTAVISARTHFMTTAYAKASIVTDTQGRATVDFKLPENLTTYRIMAIAVDKADRFGSGQSQVTVRKPLQVRPSLPRFALVGDTFEAAVVIHNETEQDSAITVDARAAGASVQHKAPKTVNLKAGGQAEVRFPLHVTDAGQASFQFVARVGDFADAAEVHLPVYVPTTAEAQAAYGVTDGVVAQPIERPKDSLEGYGGLELEVSSTALVGLKDAITYLNDYPYGCLEQTSSRTLPMAIMGDILQDFQIDGLLSKKERTERVESGIKRIASMQKFSGGFGYWPGSDRVSPYASAYAMWVLHQADLAGYPVTQQVLQRGTRYLRNSISRDLRRKDSVLQRATMAPVALTLAEMGRPLSSNALDQLYKERKVMPIFAVFQLMGALHIGSKGKDERVAELRQQLMNTIDESAANVHFVERTEHALGILMHSTRRTDAIGLYVLMKTEPAPALTHQLMRSIMSARSPNGRWHTTQENAWAMAAIAAYYRHHEKEAPNFTARMWYGQGFIGQQDFKGRSANTTTASVPMAFLKEAGDDTLTLERQGDAGKLHYRVGLRYAPSTIELPPAERGYSVVRHYAPAAGQPWDAVVATQDGWKIKAGSTVRVTLTIVANGAGHYVAVDDPLPAGFEAIDTNLRTTADGLSQDNNLGVGAPARRWWWWHHFNHIEQRDDRVQLFADTLPAGVYTYTYLARATSIGTFTLPPLKAERMYQPEVFGRSAMGKVEVVQ